MRDEYDFNNARGNFYVQKEKKENERMLGNEESWNYAMGMIKKDGLEALEDFNKYIEKR